MGLGIRIAISVCLLAWLGSSVGWLAIPDYAQNAELSWLVGAIAAITLSRLLMPAKWQLLLEAKNVHIRYWRLLGIYYAANFVGQVLPATVGTDLIRLHYMATLGASRLLVGASILVERFLGLLGLLVLGSTGVSVLLLYYSNVDTEISLSVVIVGLVGVFVVLQPDDGIIRWASLLPLGAASIVSAQSRCEYRGR